MEINWQEIDKAVEDYNRYFNRKQKLKELFEFYKQLRKNNKFYGK